MSNFDSVFVNGISLRPAPFVSTSYEYNMAGQYIIGGFLIVNLSGTIVGQDIVSQINSLSSLQSNTDCVSVIIGCSGGTDFLEGSGRIRSINITSSDQPYTASYSMQIAVQSIGGGPAVSPDPEFLEYTCLTNAPFLLNYNETLNVIGEGNVIGSVDDVLQVSKSYIKASGRISITSYTRTVCGVPSYNALTNSLNILQQRASSLMSMNVCDPNNSSPLSQFSGWNKWLDTKSLTIDDGGNIEWSFDMYLSKGGCRPIAWIDIATEDKKDQIKQLSTKTINGTIKGLSSAAIGDYLADKVDATERMSNAQIAFSALQNIVINGQWPSDSATLTSPACSGNANSPCANPPVCLQRISSSTKKSPVTGEISFTATFADVNSCFPSNIELTVDENKSTPRHAEHIIPGLGDSVVVDIDAPSPHTIKIVARGSIQNCDKTLLSKLMSCVDGIFLAEVNKVQASGTWILKNERKNIGTFSYSLEKEFVECDP